MTNRINLTPVALMEGMALAATLFKDTPTRPQYDNVACAVFMQVRLGRERRAEGVCVCRGASLSARWLALAAGTSL